MATRTYNSRVRVANWNEEIQLEEVSTYIHIIIPPKSIVSICILILSIYLCFSKELLNYSLPTKKKIDVSYSINLRMLHIFNTSILICVMITYLYK